MDINANGIKGIPERRQNYLSHLKSGSLMNEHGTKGHSVYRSLGSSESRMPSPRRL
jgi:hypothetical protein